MLYLANNDLLIFRDVASQYYLEVGQSGESTSATARLISGNLSMLQSSLYFQVHTTPITGFWTITSVATGKFLKVDTSITGNQNKLSWTDTNPSNDFVVDKSPYYFSFTQVPGTRAHDTPNGPVLYVLGTYYNGGLTMQLPGGAGSDPIFAFPQAVPGTPPEITFEITVPTALPTTLSKTTLEGLALNPSAAAAAGLAGGAGGVISSSGGGGSGINGWAIAFIVLISILALIVLAYGIYMLYKYYTSRQVKRQGIESPVSVTTTTPSTEVPTDSATASASVTTSAPAPTPAASISPPAASAPAAPVVIGAPGSGGETTIAPAVAKAAVGGKAQSRRGGLWMNNGGSDTEYPSRERSSLGSSIPTLPSPFVKMQNPYPPLQTASGHGTFGIF